MFWEMRTYGCPVLLACHLCCILIKGAHFKYKLYYNTCVAFTMMINLLILPSAEANKSTILNCLKQD